VSAPPESDYRGTLYLVGTPIGNLEDISLRALRVLREVSLVAAEDTRQTRKLLDRYEIDQSLTSYFEHNERARIGPLLERLRLGDVALVSEAGMPGISDPGYDLVVAAIAAGVRIVPIPGPSAPIAALAASGLPTDQFVYLGFLPRRSSERRQLWESLRGERRTIVSFEAPHRLVASLGDALSVLGDRPIAVARELTKVHEEFVRGTLQLALQHFTEQPPRGELTLVIGGMTVESPAIDVGERIKALLADRRPPSEIAATIARESGASRREVYRLLLAHQKDAKM
jgi:16S rRNA (cytidine1402-2'-O)-methyltransferase